METLLALVIDIDLVVGTTKLASAPSRWRSHHVNKGIDAQSPPPLFYLCMLLLLLALIVCTNLLTICELVSTFLLDFL